MSHKFVLRIAKLKSLLQVHSSANHNFRVVMPTNADTARSDKNENVGPSESPEEMANLIDERMKTVQDRDAKATHLVEYVVSASPEALSDPSFDEAGYWKACMEWITKRHRAENVVSAWIHRDEDTPHLHVHVVPISMIEEHTRKRSVVVGRNPDGSQRREIREFVEPAKPRLSANQKFGGPGKLSEMQSDFERSVGRRYGLSRERRFTGKSERSTPYESPREYRARLEKWEKDLQQREKDLQRHEVELAEARKAAKEQAAVLLARAKTFERITKEVTDERLLDAVVKGLRLQQEQQQQKKGRTM